ncbi:MAG TPA: PP2C family serine/threonine-protein phosphatase [Gammaproteobacteria bacterium]|nr:PP2C family serine/threonine-protein phosphatase [Gammaproteobacteria bacterium]
MIADTPLAVPVETLPTVAVGVRHLQSAAFSERGARAENEDRLGWLSGEGWGYWALADGLGGYRGGSRAAQLAVTAALDVLARGGGVPLDEALCAALHEADALIKRTQAAAPEWTEMRSTLVLLGVRADAAAWAHAGDSRLYHFRGGRLRWRTRDHSAVQLLVSAGELPEEAIASHPDRSRLVSCLGAAGDPLVSVQRLADPVAAGDAFLLCSDGVWEHFTDGQLETLLALASDPVTFLQRLTAEVRAAATAEQDNYSAIAVFVGEG